MTSQFWRESMDMAVLKGKPIDMTALKGKPIDMTVLKGNLVTILRRT